MKNGPQTASSVHGGGHEVCTVTAIKDAHRLPAETHLVRAGTPEITRRRHYRPTTSSEYSRRGERECLGCVDRTHEARAAGPSRPMVWNSRGISRRHKQNNELRYERQLHGRPCRLEGFGRQAGPRSERRPNYPDRVCRGRSRYCGRSLAGSLRRRTSNPV